MYILIYKIKFYIIKTFIFMSDDNKLRKKFGSGIPSGLE